MEGELSTVLFLFTRRVLEARIGTVGNRVLEPHVTVMSGWPDTFRSLWAGYRIPG